MSLDVMQPFSVSLHKVYFFPLLLSLLFLLWWHHFVVKSPDKAEGISLCVYTRVFDMLKVPVSSLLLSESVCE